MEQNKKKSRRLKHFKDNKLIFIRTQPRPDLQQKILETVDECVRLDHKHKIQGKTLQTDVKLIEKSATVVTQRPHGFNVLVDLHVHHYTKVNFDWTGFMVKLNTVLDLSPASVHETVPVKEQAAKQAVEVSKRTSAFE